MRVPLLRFLPPLVTPGPAGAHRASTDRCAGNQLRARCGIVFCVRSDANGPHQLVGAQPSVDMARMIILKLTTNVFDNRNQESRYIAFEFQTHFLHVGVVDCAHDVRVSLTVNVWYRESECIHAKTKSSW